MAVRHCLRSSADQHSEEIANVTVVSEYVIAHPACVTTRRLVIFKAFLYAIRALGQPVDPVFEVFVAKFCPMLSAPLFGRTIPQ
jgi:hypothetical protein